MTPTCTGTVTRFGAAWGFIKRDDGAGDVFVHFRHLLDRHSLIPGERVEFKVVPVRGKACACAIEVRVVS